MKIANYKTSKVGWVLDYNESKIETRTAARIGGNIAGSHKTVAKIFNHYAHKRQSANLKNRFIHLKLSLSPLDENISSGTFRKITEKVLEGLGLAQNPHIIYRHYDTEHPHIHVVISRITFDGKLVRDSFDGLKIKRLEQELEKAFGLTPSFSRILSPKGIRMPQKWEKQRTEQTGVKSIRNYIQCAIVESLQGKPSLTVFVKRLERRGIKIYHREIHRGPKTFHGLSYSLDPSLVKIHFRENDHKAIVAGVGPSELDKLSNIEPNEIEHPFFGNVTGRMITNSRGIPEFCLNDSKPEENLRPYSFRAANLGPFFQYDSIMKLLSEVEPDTLETITLKANKKPKPEDYHYRPLTAGEGLHSKLIFASEIKSKERIKEAINDGLNLADIEQLDRACTRNELAFIRLVLEENQDLERQAKKSPTPTVEEFSKLVLRYQAITGLQPDTPTIKAITLIAEKQWKELQEVLTQATTTDNRKQAVNPSIMYLGLPSVLAFTMLDYQRWYNGQSYELVEDDQSSQRERRKNDTKALLQALNNFDEKKVRKILDQGNPDVSEIPLEHLGKVTDPELSRRLRNMAFEKGQSSTDVLYKKDSNSVHKHDYVEEKVKNKSIEIRGPDFFT